MYGVLIGALLGILCGSALAWKWSLGVRRVTIMLLALGIAAGLLVGLLDARMAIGTLPSIALTWLLTLMMAASILGYRFYRDPERIPPEWEGVIVSPADGKVIYVRESKVGILPVSTKWGSQYPLVELTGTTLRSDDSIVIGIAMSFLDVHINRGPIAGHVTLVRHFPGRFGSLRRSEAVFENERATTLIEHGDLQVAVVQIASRLVRQIVSFVKEGQDVLLGQRIGVIRLGSQVDLVLPVRQDLTIAVRPGERVVAGVSVVAIFDQVAAALTEASGESASPIGA